MTYNHGPNLAKANNRTYKKSKGTRVFKPMSCVCSIDKKLKKDERLFRAKMKEHFESFEIINGQLGFYSLRVHISCHDIQSWTKPYES